MAGPSPFITAEDLAARVREGGSGLRIVDCRWVLGEPGAGRRAYDGGHLPSAVHLDIDEDLSDPAGLGAPGRHPLPSPAAFAARMRAIGLRDDDLVVAYDELEHVRLTRDFLADPRAFLRHL